MALPKTYKQAVFNAMGGELALEEVPLVMPRPGEILVKVEACGVCHTDACAQYNVFGGGFPIVPGHEIIGKVAALGDGVAGWEIGDRIGGAWHAGHDDTCDNCKLGYYQLCEPYVVNGVTKPGGYAEFCILRAQAAVRIPANVDAAKYAPMLCAGATAFVALRTAGLKPGATVAVQGIGGVGHMVIQFARKMGYRVVAISRGREKEKDARALGAHEYIDSSEVDAGAALRDIGRVALVLTTALAAGVMPPLIKGIGSYGKMIILSLLQQGDITINSTEMFIRGISVQALPTGPCIDSELAVKFAHLHDMECWVQTFPLERAKEAYDAMMAGKSRFRAVIVMA
ncbi:alcohol dehydrogenase GroES-like domain-containing protein [Xylariales sp. PMI_506]|nr:alcohol dehydrogenase GroES-like domain-containing protein [Xylariales sp. PMI_506]